jgi:hypothetical protein
MIKKTEKRRRKRREKIDFGILPHIGVKDSFNALVITYIEVPITVVTEREKK